MDAPGKCQSANSSDTETELGLLKVKDFTSEEITSMVDLISQFRTLGLAQTISLPQLVVAGDQSVGKSSLLENLTDIPFPIGASVCTRFATEVNLRRGERNSVEARIRTSTPQKAENVEPFIRQREGKFDKEYFKQLLDDATEFLDSNQLDWDKKLARQNSTSPNIIDDQVLVIDVTGPEYSLLSFVDTPGLIRYEKGSKDEVETLVGHLIEQPRTIIVTVMSATSNYETQAIFNVAKAKDPEGSRTIGVLTRCDKLSQGSSEEALAVELASNTKRMLRHGWFAVRNKDSLQQDKGVALHVARSDETDLFAKSPWAESKAGKGISALRSYLVDLFGEHVSKEFPNVLREMREKLKVAEEELLDHGPARDTPESQKRYLVDLTDEFAKRVKDQKENQVWRFVEQLEADFKDRMSRKGCRRPFVDIKTQPDPVLDEQAGRPYDVQTTRGKGTDPDDSDILVRINRKYHESRGASCHGFPSSDLVEELFKEQTEPWEAIGLDLLSETKKKLFAIICDGVRESCNDKKVCNRVTTYLAGQLESAFYDTTETLRDYLAEQYGRHYYAESDFPGRVFEARAKRLVAALQLLGDQPTDKMTNEPKSRPIYARELPFAAVLDGLVQHPLIIRNSMQQTRDTVYQVHDSIKCYYDIVEKRFLARVMGLSSNLIHGANSPLARLSRKWVEGLTERQLNDFAKEDHISKSKRNALEHRIASLREAIALSEARVPGLEAYHASQWTYPEPPRTPQSQRPAPTSGEAEEAPTHLPSFTLDVSPNPTPDGKSSNSSSLSAAGTSPTTAPTSASASPSYPAGTAQTKDTGASAYLFSPENAAVDTPIDARERTSPRSPVPRRKSRNIVPESRAKASALGFESGTDDKEDDLQYWRRVM